MALINIESAFLDLFKAAHTAEHDLSALLPQHISVAAAAVADVDGTPKFKGNVVSVAGSPIKFSAADQLWNPAKLSSLIMDGYITETDPAVFTSNTTKEVYTETGTIVLRLETLTGDGAADLDLIKDRLGVLTNYDFATAGNIVTGEGTAGLVTVTATDGTSELDGSALNSADFDHVYKLSLGSKLFDGELVFVVGGNGTVELQSKDLGDVATKQSV
ncbi:hypothetical protein NFI00_000219 [Salmonella enterica]|nr:hypothetical protein [Salmonella enterica subsp. enterica serovar Minnesota]EJI5696516.1 hypothetical protein [Salmonella enterica]